MVVVTVETKEVVTSPEKENHLVCASFEAPSIRMIEQNVLRLVRPVTNVENRATLL